MGIRCSRCRKQRPETHVRQVSGRPVCKKCAAESATRQGGRRPTYYPTAEQIATACEGIRKGDTEEQLRKRSVMKPTPYTIQEIHVSIAMAEKINERRIRRHGY